MARSSIPDFGVEYPEYKYRPWPKYVGLDEAGQALIAEDQAQFNELKELAVYPKVIGKDRDGKEVVAQNSRDEELFKGKVVKSDKSDKPNTNELTGETEVRRGPGRPAKVA